MCLCTGCEKFLVEGDLECPIHNDNGEDNGM